MKIKFSLLFLILFFISSFQAQRNLRDSIIGTPWVAIHYGGNWSKKDLANRFGYWNHLGMLVGYKTSRNWYLGFDWNFLYSNQVKAQGLFDDLIDEKGNITDVNGDIATVLVFGRGANVNVSIGKVIPKLSPNKNSGFFFHIGGGYAMNKFRIETRDHVVPLLEKEYRKGYDRYVHGFNIHEFIGYSFFHSKGVVNFYGGFYAQQAFTKYQRKINFDEPDIPVPSNTLYDFQIGFKLGWFIPIYRRNTKDYYYN
ncbi:MAG: hypothetical protein HYU67_11060 [Flavobacteriia bacterium]|nr:hypothetical protein [Flavobacteriia bacterium]